MANIPDEAIDAMNEVSKTAFAMYAYLCRRRNRKTGVCFPSLRRVAEECGICYTYASEMRKELLSAGWLEMDPNGHFRPLKGFGKSETQSPLRSSENPNIEFGKSEHAKRKSSENPKGVSENPKPKFGKSETLYKGINQRREPEKVTRERGRASARNGSRGTRLPETFSITDSMRGWASTKTPLVNLEIETEKFTAYYQSVSGTRGVKLDWSAAWRSWMLKAIKEYTNGQNQTGRPGPRRSTADTLAEYDAMFAKYR